MKSTRLSTETPVSIHKHLANKLFLSEDYWKISRDFPHMMPNWIYVHNELVESR